MATVVDAPSIAGSRPRITGIDVARAMAMLGMVIVHYVFPDRSGHVIDRFTQAVNGRAMPLFMLLGGIGVTLLAERASRPDRTLLIRAAVLFVTGLILHEISAWVAVVLQFYGLLFAVAPLLRRLSSPALVAGAVATAALGGWTYQVFVTGRPLDIEFAGLGSPGEIIEALFVAGWYPFFPVGAFFLLGLWLGRLDLRSTAVASGLTAVGLVVGFGSWLAADALVVRRSPTVASTLLADVLAARPGADPTGAAEAIGAFSWDRLLDVSGHSEMWAWSISAAGTSVAVLGLCLLLTPRLGPLLSPVVALGQLALTFYVLQVVLTVVIPSPAGTSFTQELITVALLYGGFMAFAYGWRQVLPAGPLETALRFVSDPRRWSG